MKKLLLILLSVSSLSAFGWTQRQPEPIQNCAVHSPYGFPQANPQVAGICRQAYLVGYDAAAKIPKFVTYELTPPNALGCVARTNAFAADQSVPGGATPDDYAATGYDKGHMAPDGDLSWDTQVEFESFLMTNMAPQAGSLNRGIWKLLETSVRGWAVQLNQPLVIYAGPLYDKTKDKTIGNGVTVPHGYFKVVVNTVTKEYAAWQFPNEGDLGNDLTKLRVKTADVTKLAGLTLPLPKDAKELALDKAWAVNFGALTKAKRDKCGKSDD